MAFSPAFGAETLIDAARRIGAGDPGRTVEINTMLAELHRERAENTLQGPEVEFGYKFNNTAGGENRWGLSVSQDFDWLGVYGARRKALNYRSQAYSMLVFDSFIESALKASDALADLGAARQRLALLDSVAADYADLAKIYSGAYSDNLVTVMSVRKLGIETFALDRRIAEARAALTAAESRLRAMDVDPATISLDTPAIPSLAPQEVYRRQLMDRDLGVKAATMLKDAADADMSVARRTALPSFSVGYTHDYEEGQHFNGFSVGISLPSWAPRSSILAAGEDAASRAASARLTLAQRTAAVDADYAEATVLIAALTRGESTFATDDYPAILRTLFDRGELTMPQYLYEYTEYIDAKLDYIDMQWRLAAAALRMNRFNLLPL